MTALMALTWTTKLLAFAMLLQNIEFFRLRPTFQESGVWRWSLIREDFKKFPFWIRRILDLFLQDRGFDIVLIVRILASVALLFQSGLPMGTLFVLLFTTLLITMRFRGPFNGGSDSMTVLLLLVLSLVSLRQDHPLWLSGGTWYVALQTSLSFLIAGVVKIRHSSWRRGEALRAILRLPTYDIPSSLRGLANSSNFCLFGSWLILLFECSFPLALLHPFLATFYLVLAFLFQLANYSIFGLNRFLWAWLAAYPTIFWCSL